MGMLQNDGITEGWLYLIRSNRIGIKFARRRYFVFKDNCLRCYKGIPISERQEPVRSAIIDSCIRVSDDGRESIHSKVIFIFTLYNTSNQSDRLKLGASSPEEAARWIRSLQDSALKEWPNQTKNCVDCSKRKCSSLRLDGSKREHERPIDWTIWSSMLLEAMTSDVIASSPWKIFGFQNGLRLFREAKDWDSYGRIWDDHPAIMAVSVIDGTSEAIFRTLMSLGHSRSEWDFSFYRGSVIEHIDGHTDIIHKLLYSNWLPRGMRRRDLLLRRYWRREDDGTYVILYHSVSHKKCRPKKGYVRACLKSGGFVVTPVNQGKQSLVKHMLAIDWKLWKMYLRPSSAISRSITIRMLERVAALGEMFKAKAGNHSSEFLSGDSTRDIGLPQSEEDKHTIGDEFEKPPSSHASLMGRNDASDEFFDVPEPDSAHIETEWPSGLSVEVHSPNRYQPRLSSAASFVKRLHEIAVQKKGYVGLPDLGREDSITCSYGTTLHRDPSCGTPCSWAEADPSSFLIRGENYSHDHQKIKAKGTLMQMVGADWIKSDRREDDLASRCGSIVQKSLERGEPEFFFIVNIQVPGKTMYTLALYYMMKTPLEDNLLLHAFVNGDDAFRNSRFKLIPYISKGSWIVKQSVGKKACLVGQALNINYFRGENYLELEIDVGSSTVARGVVSLVLGYLNNLVIEMAFLIQGNTDEELPEELIGTCRLNHLDASKSVRLKS